MEDGAKVHREGRYAEAEESWRVAVKEAERFGAEDQRDLEPSFGRRPRVGIA